MSDNERGSKRRPTRSKGRATLQRRTHAPLAMWSDSPREGATCR